VSHDQQAVAHEHGHVEIDNALGLELAQQVADRNLFNVVEHDGDGERMRLGQVCGETFRKSHLVELVLGVVERNAQRFFEYELLAVLQRDLSRRRLGAARHEKGIERSAAVLREALCVTDDGLPHSHSHSHHNCFSVAQQENESWVAIGHLLTGEVSVVDRGVEAL
jgi:hypothetical protein